MRKSTCCCLVFALLAAPAAAATPQLIRGDADGSGALEITDALQPLFCLFLGEPCPVTCMDAADADDNGVLQLTDAVRILGYLFLGGQPPAPPFPACGPDPTADDLPPCVSYAPCADIDDFEAIAAGFGRIETIAGKGETQDDNGWREAFENGPAVDCELSAPHNAMGDALGNVFIADKEAHGIRKITPEGAIVTVAGTNAPGDGSDEPGPGTARALQNPNGLHVREDGTVYILDLDNDKVRRLDPDGTLTTLFTTPGLTLGRGLWVSPGEDVAYVSSGSRLLRWTLDDGAAAKVFADGFDRLGNIAVNDRGELLATDQGAHQVYRVLDDNRREVIAGNGGTSGGGDGQPALETGLNEVRGIWAVPGRGYFLATHAGSQVWYVDTGGIIHLFLDGRPGAHAGDGEVWNHPAVRVSEVRNITLDPSGNLLVTEHDHGFVRRVGFAGAQP